MSVPAQVRKQSETVQALYDEMKQDNKDPANPDPAEPQQPVVSEPAAPVDQSTSSKPEDFEQKYRSLQGKYNAEVPKLSAQVRDLGDQVKHLQSLLASVSTPPAAPAPAAAPKSNRAKEVTAEDEKEYGDALDTMRRAARDEMRALYQDEIDNLKRTIDGLTGKLNKEVVPAVNNVVTRQQETAEQRFWSDLTSAVPNWQTINNDPNFHTWLLETDPVSRLSRQSALEEAQATGDVQWVAQIFKEWIGPEQPAPANNGRGKQDELEKQVSPGKSKSGQPPAQPNQKTYSREDVSNFYKDVASGKYRGRDQERAKIESDIFAAQRDGRLT